MVGAIVGDVAGLLFENAPNADEGVRAMVAECLGKLALVQPTTMLPRMAAGLADASALTRGTMVSALKYAVPTGEEATFATHVPAFLALMTDADIGVRRQAFLTFNNVAHVRFMHVRPRIVDYMAMTLAETKAHPELIRVEDYGPFTRKVDDGFPLRKAVYQCIDTCFDVGVDYFPNVMDVIMTLIMNGTADEEKDIQVLAYQILFKFAQPRKEGLNTQRTLLEAMFNATVPAKIKEGVVGKLKEAKGAEPEKANEVLRAAVRTLHAMRWVPGASRILLCMRIQNCQIFRLFGYVFSTSSSSSSSSSRSFSFSSSSSIF